MTSEFKELLQKKLNINADEYLSQFPCAYHACIEVLNTDKHWEGNVSKFPFARCQFLLLLEWKGYTPNSKLKEASLFELEIITKRSPFYAFTTFNVPFEECVKMCQCLELKLPDEIFAYNIALRELSMLRTLTFERLASLLEEHGIDMEKLPLLSTVAPFGAGVLWNHPLKNVNPRHISPAECSKLLLNPSQVISKTRERENLVNKLISRDNTYMLECPIVEFVDFINTLRS